MNIAWIGGVSRGERILEREAEMRGHRLECHTGRTAGRGVLTLRAAVERADLVVAITDVNSHNAVQYARSVARELDRPFVLMRKCGLARFRALLADLDSDPRALRELSRAHG